jgi:tetratricopeptide (TPR) repeat protein/transcriptional regulator with XRE-family HTH domain
MFGELVRSHRVRLGMTQEELATLAKLSVRGIGKIESGRSTSPRPFTVRLLADAFGLTGDARDQFCAAATLADEPRPRGGYSTLPAQLPADVRAFTARSAELGRLDELSPGARSRAADATVAIAVLSGTAGIGKTALAVHWAQRERHRFPDGQLYVNLRGFDPSGSPVTAAEAVRRFLDAFEVPPQQIPHSFDAQVDLYRSLLAGKRVLVVLDNARDAEQVRPLLPGGPGCMAIVTSRNRLSGLVAESAHPLTLDLLAPAEARELLVSRLGQDRVAAEPDAVDEIVRFCARLPLALAVVAARAAGHPGFRLDSLAAELRAARGSLDTFAGADRTTDARAVFSWSAHQLSPAAARLFRLLGLHPGPDITVPAAASLAGQAVPEVRRLLADLSEAHLVTEHTPGRFTFHDLLRAYAAEETHTVDTDDDRATAIHRLFDHYVHTAHTAARLLQPARDPLPLTPPLAGVTPEHPATHGEAIAWFIADHAVLLAVVEHATRTGADIHTWQLACTLPDFLDWHGHWHDGTAVLEAALDAARRLGDPHKEARVHHLIAGPYIHLNRTDDADTHLKHALDLYEECGDQAGQAHAHTSVALVLERQGRLGEALEHTEQALALFRAAGHEHGQARSLNNLGWAHAQLGDPAATLDYCQQALERYEELGSRHGQAMTWDSLGYGHQHLGDHDAALSCYQHALDLVRDIGNRWEEAVVLTHIGDTYAAMGDGGSADTAWRQALAIFEQFNHPNAERLRAKLRNLTAEHDPS